MCTLVDFHSCQMFPQWGLLITSLMRSHETPSTRDRSIPRRLRRWVSTKSSISQLTFLNFIVLLRVGFRRPFGVRSVIAYPTGEIVSGSGYLKGIAETETDKFPVGFSVDYCTQIAILRHVRTYPHGEKKVIFECSSVGTSAHHHIAVLRTPEYNVTGIAKRTTHITWKLTTKRCLPLCRPAWVIGVQLTGEQAEHEPRKNVWRGAQDIERSLILVPSTKRTRASEIAQHAKLNLLAVEFFSE